MNNILTNYLISKEGALDELMGSVNTLYEETGFPLDASEKNIFGKPKGKGFTTAGDSEEADILKAAAKSGKPFWIEFYVDKIVTKIAGKCEIKASDSVKPEFVIKIIKHPESAVNKGSIELNTDKISQIVIKSDTKIQISLKKELQVKELMK